MRRSVPAALVAAMVLASACGARRSGAQAAPPSAATVTATASATATARASGSATATAGDSAAATPLRITRTATTALRRVAPPASSAPAPGIEDVAFTDARHGVLVTGGVLIGTSTGTTVSGVGRVQVTGDGGQRWTTVWQSANAVLSWVGFADPQHAFAAGRTFPSANASGRPLLLVSTDGGQRWRAIRPSLPTGAIAAWSGLRFDFVTPEDGYAVTDPDLSMGPGAIAGVLRTTDGGRTWTLVPLPGGTATGGLAFVSAATGYVTGTSHACVGAVWETTDGGSTWRLLAASCRKTYRLRSLDFLNARTGFAAGGRNQKWSNPPWQAVIVTHDGGRTWQTLYTDTAHPDPFGDAITRLHFSDAQHGWAVTGGCVMGQNTPCAGEVLITADGGSTWRAAGQSATHLATVSPARAWAVPPGPGGSGLLWVTSDGGAAWQPLGQPRAANYDAVRSVGSSLLLVGATGFLLSRDGGHTWQRLPGAPSGFPGADVALASGLIVAMDPSGQGLQVSRDGGATWSRVPVAAARRTGLSSFAFTPDGRGLAATYGSTCLNPVKGGRVQPSRLVSSSDAGRTWIALPQPGLAIAHLAAATGLAAALGERNCTQVVGISRDGGRTWQTQSLPKGLICSHVTTAPPDAVWLACLSVGAGYTTDSTLLLSHDGGATWSEFTARGTAVSSLAADSATTGWMTADGALWRTTDGGQTWTERWPAVR